MSVIHFLKKIVPKHLRDQPGIQKLRILLRLRKTLVVRLRRQLSFANAAESKMSPKLFSGKRVLLLLIETSHYQHQHMLGIAKVLQLRGAEVKVLICGEVLDGCEIKSVRRVGDRDPCWACRIYARHTIPLYGLETVKLADFLSTSEIEEIRLEAAECVAREKSIQRYGTLLDQAVWDSVIRYYYGALPKEKDKILEVQRAHSMSALLTAEVVHRIEQQWTPDVVLCNMSCYSPYEAFYKFYNSNGRRFRLVSLTQFDFKAVKYNKFDLFGDNNRFSRYISARSSSALTDMEKRKLKRFIDKRLSGQADIFRLLRFFEKDQHAIGIDALRVDKEKRNIFLFSNIYWDVGLSERAGCYQDVISWVLATIDLVKNNRAIHLYIKPHPGEIFDTASSLKGIRQIVLERYPQLPNNVTIIEPEWKINTYDLFTYIDLGVIFTGTLGLEMMLAGIPVVSTGATTHYGLGFAAEPKTEAEYRSLLLGEQETPKYSRESLELFAYFYFVRSNMPWSLTKQAYGDNFDGFNFRSLNDILPGNDPYIDHLCSCIMAPENTVAEAWPG